MTSATAAQTQKPATATAGSLKDVIAAPTAICTIDGIEGRLIYRGYQIEDLAANATFEEVVYLLWEGDLPNKQQLEAFTKRLTSGRRVPDVLLEHLRMIPPSAHPLAALRSGVSLLSHSDPDSESMDYQATRAKAERLLGQVPTIVTARARIRQGLEPIAPRDDLPAASNFLWMLFGKEPDSVTAHAMDVAFTLHAEHEFNASSFAARVAAGTYVDLHSSIVAALAALKGPRHGGANEDVIEMIEEVGSPEKAEPWARERLQRYLSASRDERAKPGLRFPGMGHAVYKTWDPRARILQKLAGEVAELHGEGWIAQIQETVRGVAAEGLGLNPNVDYYSAGLYHALGIPSDLFTSIFATSRTAGYVAHIEEQLKGGRLIRPRGEYTGPRDRKFVPLAER
ncbi:MAG TPA: citrate/2-methylcitrate synthase [Chloroflexota bacterium]|nr:citrate/2-methylcitrate synthase [Chloroflexota bacterium]